MNRMIWMNIGMVLLAGSVALRGQTGASSAAQQTVQKDRSAAKIAATQVATPGETKAVSGSYNAKISTARQQVGSGDLDRAITTSQEAINEAKAAGDNRAHADAALTYARSLEIKNSGQKDPARMVDVISAYDDAARVGDAKQRATALNSKSVALLQINKPAEALTSLKQIDITAIDGVNKLGYQYNLARAYEASGTQYSRQSYDQYVRVLKEKPGYGPALEGAFRVLNSEPKPRIDDAVTLGMFLLSSGQTESAGQYMRLSVERWSSQPDAQKLLAVMVHYYATAPVSTGQFKEKEWPWLEKLSGKAPPLLKAISEIGKAYSDDVHPVFEPYDAWAIFPAWSHDLWKQNALGALLKSIGNERQQQKQLSQALTHYTLAWFLDPTDSESAVYAAVLLRDNKQLLDTQGQLFNQLLRGIFDIKGEAYNKQDWPNILRLHTILGTIFEREKKWGPDSDPRSAIFQWQHAIEAERRARQENPKLAPSPGLYLKLGDAYRATNRPQLALPQYLSAVEGYLTFSAPDEAKNTLQKIHSLNVALSAEQQEQLRNLEAKTSQLEGSA